MTTTMKAVRFHPPGGPEKLAYGDEPALSPPGNGEVVVQVFAAGLIWPELYWPIYQNKDSSWKTHIPAHDYAGIITAMGPGCEGHGLSVGSEVCVFTSRRNHGAHLPSWYRALELTEVEGGLAEYAKADIDQVVAKPKNLSFAEAATIPLSALTAWQALFVRHKLLKGQRILITAGAGGTGVFAVQFAKNIGAHVIATGSAARSKEILEQFGVDEFIDYKKTALTEAVKEVDFVLDCVGDKAIDDCFKVVKKDGVVVSIASLDAAEKAAKLGIDGDFFIVSMDADQMQTIVQMIENGTVKPVLDKTFPLERTREAFEEASRGGGAAHGKFVITTQ